MKHWKETAQIVDRVVALASAGRRAALATAVRISGSSYRRPGAKFLIEEDGATLGGVSGGCLEADVREIANGVIRTGSPRLLHYETGSDDRTVWGLGLGCNGSVDIFVQAATEPPAIEILRECHPLLKENAGPLAISTVVDGQDDVGRSMLVDARGSTAGSTGNHELDRHLAHLGSRGLIEGRSQLVEIDGRLVFTDVLIVPVTLIVCGAGDDARPLVAYASDVGFAVTVVDHRADYLSPARFPGARALLRLRPGDDIASLAVGTETLVVVKTHSLSHDREWVRSFLQAGAGYVGLLGPRARKEEIVEQVGDGAGRVFGPVGLDIGADGPEEIAISVIAELLAVRSGRRGSHLREKRETIHAG
jgi:xanthine/CO dehydrogenase XdhC/CoxF family maturation factor